MKINEDELFAGVDEWPVIVDRMKTHRVTPAGLSKGTGVAEASILRGINDRDFPVTLRFLRDCVKVFNLLSQASGRSQEDVINHLTYDDCMALLRPPPAMPPLPGNFWERDD
ncbi:MAG: hypothetical protein V1823_01830 [Chloroflexota bacterium]